jgi:chemotaxis protein CheC
MIDLSPPDCLPLESLRRLCVQATESASSAMCRWTGTRIHLGLDEVYEVPLENVCAELEIGDDLLTMVVVRSTTEMGAEIILMFGEASSRKLAACLLGRVPDDCAEWNELERSSLTETGNILACAYLNVMAQLIGGDLLPSPPLLLRDYGASVVQQALMPQAMECDRVLVCRTTFQQDGEQLDWKVLFIPTEVTRRRIENAVRRNP